MVVRKEKKRNKSRNVFFLLLLSCKLVKESRYRFFFYSRVKRASNINDECFRPLDFSKRVRVRQSRDGNLSENISRRLREALLVTSC